MGASHDGASARRSAAPAELAAARTWPRRYERTAGVSGLERIPASPGANGEPASACGLRPSRRGRCCGAALQLLRVARAGLAPPSPLPGGCRSSCALL
jgi:hypothetical protein